MSKWKTIRDNHPNSIESYYEGKLSGAFSDREEKIMTALRAISKGTDRDIKDFLGVSDMNSVRPRITELIDEAGLIEECGFKTDDITGKKVRIVRIIPEEDKNQLSLFS